MPEFCLKMPELYLKISEFCLKMPEFYLKMPEFCLKMPELYLKIPEFCLQMPEFYLEMPTLSQNFRIVPQSTQIMYEILPSSLIYLTPYDSDYNHAATVSHPGMHIISSCSSIVM